MSVRKPSGGSFTSKKKNSVLTSHKYSSRDNKDDSEDLNKFLEICRAVYTSLLNDVEEDITTTEELMQLLQHAGCNPSKKSLGKYWDEDTDSYNFKQFCEIAKQERQTSKKDLMKAFQKIDINRDGFITHDELFHVLTKRGERMTKAEVKTMIEDADFNGDGRLDYEEFCDMMDSTTKMCQQLYTSPNEKQQQQRQSHSDKRNMSSSKSLRSNTNTAADERRKTSNRGDEKAPQGEEKAHKGEEKIPHSSSKKSFSAKSPRQQKESFSSSSTKETAKNEKEKLTLGSKLKEEPRDLNKWTFQSLKGCFYKEENGKMESHQYQMKVTQPTTVWMTIKPSSPKYGKFCDDILENDMNIFIIEYPPSSKLVAFSNSVLDGKSCLMAELDVGMYNVLTFTSGAKLLQEESESGQVNIVKGTGEEAKLSKSCKDSFLEIFYRCDLDGNGYLSREEFNEFQLRSSGEGCDNEAWEVVKDNFDVTPQEELTPNGFIDLNLMEARDPQGGPDELWITLESMGYSRKLQLSMACPFLLEVYSTKKGKVSLAGVGDGGEPLQIALQEAIKSIATVKNIKNKRDLQLLIAEFDQRVTLAVENQSHGIVGVRLDCSASENLLSHQNTLSVSEDVEPKTMEIFHHLLPKNKNERMNLKYQETIER